MKLFPVKLNKMFQAGLRPYATLPGNGNFLTVTTNMKPYIGGMVGATKLSRSFTLNEEAQIFDCTSGVYVLTSTALYTYALGTITLVLGNIPPGEFWSCADFGEFICFSNSVVNVIRNVVTGAFSIDSGTKYPIAGAICRLRGRLIIGDVEEGEAVVKWSDIGRIKFITPSEIDLSRKNTSGVANLYQVEKVNNLLPIADGFIVYGTKGIVFMRPSPVDKAAGAMAIKDISDIGTDSKKAAIRINNFLHYFVTSDKVIHSLTVKNGEIVIDDYDYREFVEDASTLSMSWNERDKELYIGMPTTSPFLLGSALILSKYGLGSMSSYIGAAIYSRNKELIVHSPRNIKQLDTMLSSDIIDFQAAGIKSIGNVIVRGNIQDGLFVAASYRASVTEDFSNTDWIPLNSSGVAYIGASGEEFKLHIAAVDYTDVLVRELEVTVSFDDKRFRIGASYGNQDASQAGS